MDEIERKILETIYALQKLYMDVISGGAVLDGVDIHDEIDRWLRTLSIISQGKDK